MFSTTSVKPYYDRVIGGGMHVDASNDNDNAPDPPDSTDSSGPSPSPRDLSPPPDPTIEHRPEHVPTADATTPPIERGRDRPKKYPVHVNLSSDICFVVNNLDSFVIDEADLKLPQFAACRKKLQAYMKREYPGPLTARICLAALASSTRVSWMKLRTLAPIRPSRNRDSWYKSTMT